jgi:hypothetical protein
MRPRYQEVLWKLLCLAFVSSNSAQSTAEYEEWWDVFRARLWPSVCRPIQRQCWNCAPA